MIKKLQKQFVRIAMSAVAILLLVFIFATNLINVFSIKRNIDNLLDAVLKEKVVIQDEGGIKITDGSEEYTPDYTQKNQYGLFSSQKITDDEAMGARLFRVTVDNRGVPIAVETDRIVSVNSVTARNYAREVISKGKTEGYFNNFIYKISDDTTGNRTITFLDVSDEYNRALTVLQFSLGIGLFCWLLMFLFVSLLAEKTMKPVAENMEKQKQFISDAGHEIKTPLASIKANAEAMELITGETKWSKNILNQTDRLSSLVQEMLELSKNEEGADNLQIESVNLSETVTKKVDEFAEYAVSSGRVILSDIPAGITIKSNSEYIERILEVLLENAIKYSIENGKIRVVVTKERKFATVVVTNRCENLPNCEPEKLFDRFYRADQSRSSSGFGIGLSTARALSSTLGGELTAEYQDADRIIFTLSLPI